MKLKKLTIHNIASIEDATIDFSSQPLASSEVFLITGPTGAGKSTILDAICLSLFATTPRLENTNMQGASNDTGKDIKINDPRQLMRRNTGEAFCSLSFTGSNGVAYEATWSVARARKKSEGKLQSKNWQLKNLDTGLTLTKDAEIQKEIASAISLDFNQFCRTTLLAQGDFTKFLNSQDKEKAEILEKITGVDVYSKIGRKVFEITSEKEKEYAGACDLIAGTLVMSAEEAAELKREIRDIDRQLADLRQARKSSELKLNWIKTDTDLAAKETDAEEKYRAANARTESPEWQEKLLLSKQWNDTIKARHTLQLLTKAQNDARSQLVAIDGSRNDFARIRQGQLWLEESLRLNAEKQVAILKALADDKDKEQVYANLQTIIGQLDIRSAAVKKTEELTKSTDLLKASLQGELTTKKDAAEKIYSECRKRLEEHKTRLTRLEKNLETANLTMLNKEKGQLQDYIHNLKSADEKLTSIRNDKEKHRNQLADIESLHKEIGQLSSRLEALLPQIHDAQLIAKTRKEDLEKQQDSIDKWAKKVRATLHKGDVCPVCQQTILTDIPLEATLDEIYSNLKKACDNADKKVAELNALQLSLQADIKAKSESLEAGRKRSAEEAAALGNAQKAAQSMCDKCGLGVIGDNTGRLIAEKLEQAGKESESLDKRIAAADILAKDVTGCRKVADRLQAELERSNKSLEMAKAAITGCENSIATNSSLMATYTQQADAAGKEVAAMLADTRWEHAWQSDTAAFIDELKKQAKIYDSNIKALDALRQSERENSTLLKNVAEASAAIGELLPEVEDDTIGKPERMDDILTAANHLRTRIGSAMRLREKSLADAAHAQKDLDAYLYGHEEYSRQLLETLHLHPAEEINAINAEIEKTRIEIAEKKSSLNLIREQRKELLLNRPDFNEGDNRASLESSIKDIDVRIQKLGEEKGAKTLRLQQDDENRRRLQTLISEAEAKKNIFDRWSRLNQLIGDSTGSKFRKIAQSYVLSNLVNSANHYMRTLTDRYSLKVEPGSFVILLVDAWQGYTCRAASTISGGEGFLVSLALALALSDIGQTLAVDTLFIDEGFGTLSGQPLHNAINTLRQLHCKGGRHVGIISHVEELRERIPVQIQLVQDGNDSKSRVLIVPEV